MQKPFATLFTNCKLACRIDVVDKVAKEQGFDNPGSSKSKVSSTKNSGNKLFLPFTYHEEKGDGWAGKKLKKNCAAVKNTWNDLTSKA